MVADIAGVHKACLEGAPACRHHALQLRGIDTIVEETPLAANKVNVEVVRLQAVDTGCDLTQVSIPELKEIAKIITTKNSGEGVLEGLDMISSEF